MKCVLCGKALRGAGAMLLDKPCACFACVNTYVELADAAEQGNERAKRLVALARARVDAFDYPGEETEADKAVAFAEKHWKK